MRHKVSMSAHPSISEPVRALGRIEPINCISRSFKKPSYKLHAFVTGGQVLRVPKSEQLFLVDWHELIETATRRDLDLRQ